MIADIYETVLDLGILGEVDCVIEYTYHEAQPDNRDSPGEPEEFTIHSITAQVKKDDEWVDTNIENLIADIDGFSKMILKEIKDYS